MPEGTVKWFDQDKRYGFIARDDDEDVFVHISEWRGSSSAPQKGQSVTFDVKETRKGLQANDVRPAPARSDDGDEYRFLNPYNFVRALEVAEPERGPQLGKCAPPPHDRYVGLSGRIECRVTVRTPLFVSDSEGAQADPVSGPDVGERHFTYRFFRYGGEPALPASSLRGMLRLVFEAATNSCFSVFAGDERLSYHLSMREARELLPGRVVRDGSDWHLEILDGMPTEHRNPLPAAWVKRYEPLRSSTTERRAPEARYSTRPIVSLSGLGHGDECQALVEEIEHPRRPFAFWNVVEVAAPDAEPLEPRNGNQELVSGYLCITNQNVENKHDERLFFSDKESPRRRSLSPKVRRRYEELIEDYQERHAEDVKNRRKRHEKNSTVPSPSEPDDDTPAFSRFVLDPDEANLEHGALVYAMLQNDKKDPVDFIVPVSVPRVGYEQTVGDRLDPQRNPEESLLHKCREYDRLCPACRVFGWVEGVGEPGDRTSGLDDRTAYAGRVSLSHATPVDGRVRCFDEDITLSILSSPKPTTTRFYLRPTDGAPKDGLGDRDVDYSEGAGQRLRGRKFYRHFGEHVGEQEFTSPDEQRTGQNRTVEGVVKPDSAFQFELRFRNLSKVELGALLWSLDLEGWNHRLGLGKPLGFGSVILDVTDLESFDAARRYGTSGAASNAELDKSKLVDTFRRAMSDRYGASFCDLDNIRDLQALLGESPDLPVHYPRTGADRKAGEKNFEWFVANKGGLKLILPLAPDDTQGFPLFE